MPNVSVNPELLSSESSSIKSSYEKNKDTYDKVNGVSIPLCTSFDTFKSSLRNKFDTYTNHVEIISKKLIECGEKLAELDNSLADNVTNPITLNTREFSSTVLAKTSTHSADSEYVNPYDPENLPDITLYDTGGVLDFEQNGKKVRETFCNIPLKYSFDLKFLILTLGYDAGFWYRDDGVQMLGEDVLYAADIPGWGENGIEDENMNPSNSTMRRGDKFYGTSGPGRIVGKCGESLKAHLGQFERNGQKYDETYDVYTAWLIDKNVTTDIDEYRIYSSRWSSKDEQYATRNVINNTPADPSQRYYQTNKAWVDLFDKYTLTREYIPDGVVDWNTDEWKTFDWEAYFQINNPDRVSA